MFLKGLEIKGFKSFADKTMIMFKDGVTGVVGPNGSGKSNISDAIRWVLGEQSIKTLRGGKMEDVIFAGTQYRKAVGLAEVSLILDNTDKKLGIPYEEVSITRRLFRSGESEYLINGSKCRLRDVQELFMDTGIGKEGYSIIGQGKIEAILSGKPEERRGLLEEAAGIVKYRSRKEEADRKLQKTDANLVRIEDILSTYEERLEPLRIENEKASLFLELSNEIKAKEITVLLTGIKENKVKLENVNLDIEDSNKILNDLHSEKEELETQSEENRVKLETLEEEIRNRRKEYYDLKDRKNNEINEISLLKEKINGLDNNFIRINRSIEESITRISKIKEERDIINENIENKNIEKEEIIIKIKEIEEKIEKERKNLSIYKENEEKDRNNEIERMRKYSEVQNKIALHKQKMDSSKDKIDILTKKSVNQMLLLDSKKASRDSIFDRERILKEQLSIKNTTMEKLTQEYFKVKTESDKIKEKLIENDRNLHRVSANHSMLKNLEKNHEGYNRTSKILISHIEENKITVKENSVKIFGDVIEVKNGYETAIEIALGFGISDIITESDEIAKKLINYLKLNNIGRVTFLPLNILKSSIYNDRDVKNVDGYLGIASSLLNYDEKYRVAVENKLGKTLIAKDMDSALKIAKILNYTARIITLEGEVVNAGGSLVGGSSAKKSGNIIGRKREIEEAEVEINEIKENIKSLSLKKEEIADKKLKFENQIKILERDIKDNEIETARVTSEYESQEIELRNKTLEYEETIKEIEETIKSREESDKEINEALFEENNLSVNEGKRSEEIIQNSLNIKNAEENIESLNREYSELKIKEGTIIQTIESLKREIDKNIESEKENNERKEIDENEKVEIFKLKDEFEKNIEGKELIKDEMEENIKKYESSFDEEDGKISKFKNTMRDIGEKLKTMHSEIEIEDNKRNKNEILKVKIEQEYNSSMIKINEDMNLTLAEAEEFLIIDADIPKIKTQIDSIKRKINEIGVVNIGAIEEYKEIKEKYTFMNEQREDLIASKNELIEVIEDMLLNMRTVFAENFQILRENFKEIFMQLFKGGSADLCLADGDELTANIDIIVEPPGKKLQNINLMSGGEKGLSAIALLFAILKMKPSPFCVLDEIEAALDDANVARYAEFLMNFSINSQFIVITHRKGTMERCDGLYGVTMEEKGVSKIVSVDLRNH